MPIIYCGNPFLDESQKCGYIRHMIVYRLQQLLILILHLILLGWMYFTLSEAGMMKVSEVLLHFLGMAIYGGLLIYGSAQWGKRLYRNEKLAK